MSAFTTASRDDEDEVEDEDDAAAFESAISRADKGGGKEELD